MMEIIILVLMMFVLFKVTGFLFSIVGKVLGLVFGIIGYVLIGRNGNNFPSDHCYTRYCRNRCSGRKRCVKKLIDGTVEQND